MPTATFFRLPGEKRDRLIEACWAEVSQVRFSEISINRIIAAAHIPRGSFYQYFEDKEELLRYLMGTMQEYFLRLLRDIFDAARGDLFAFPLVAYDRFVSRQGGTDPMLDQFIKVLQLNKGVDLHTFLGGPRHFLPDQLWELVDLTKLRRSDREYADHVFHMACAALGLALMETLCGHIGGPDPREALQARMELLRCGGAAEGYKEVAV